MTAPTDAQVTAAAAVLVEHVELVRYPHARDFVGPGLGGQDRLEALEALRRADEQAEQFARDIVRQALQAAFDAGEEDL